MAFLELLAGACCRLGLGGIFMSPPSSRPFHPQLRNLITDVSQHKLLVFAGPCVEETGELMLQTGCFSLRDFIQIFTDKEVGCWRPPGRSCLAPPPAHRPDRRCAGGLMLPE